MKLSEDTDVRCDGARRRDGERIAPEQGGEALLRVLGLAGVPQVLVAPRELEARMARWVWLAEEQRGAAEEEADAAAANSPQGIVSLRNVR